ncbi:hypothetical protein ACFL08_01335 [Patescibacteria group bacterium]
MLGRRTEISKEEVIRLLIMETNQWGRGNGFNADSVIEKKLVS